MERDPKDERELATESLHQSSTPALAGIQDEQPLLKGLLDGQEKLGQSVQDLGGQSAFLRQQISQLYDAVRQLYGAVSAQCVQLGESDRAMQEELKRFQTGGPQRAMAGVFSKLFRDLLRHMNQLDDLIRLGDQAGPDSSARPWIESLRVARNSFEAILLDWGCKPIVIVAGEDKFDPTVHEALPGGGAGGTLTGGDRITEVVRRGWEFGGAIVQHPQVIVN